VSELVRVLQEAVLSGPVLVGAPVAALAGLVSFASPCVLPLVPGYLGYVSGLGGEHSPGRGRRLLAGSVLFVLGFAAVFVVAGFVAGAAGDLLVRWQEPLSRVLGVVVIVMGLVFLGVVPGNDTERRVRWRPAAGIAGAPLLGAVFGIGWAPCIGPVFSAVAALSLSSGGAARGAVLARAYALGLGLPFVVAAVGIGRGMDALGPLRRHRRTIVRGGAAVLVAVGLLLVTGVWSDWMDAVRAWMQGESGFRTVI
jgi:cytochrome c-type biogenesis protein